MGLFFNYHRIFNEVEIDGQPVDDSNAPPADYTAEENTDQPPMNEPAPQNQDSFDNPPPDEGGEQPTTDYTEQDFGDDNPPPEDGGGNPPPQDEPKPVDELKAKEEELYSNLTPEQLDIKHRELKNRFLEMFDITTEIIDRIGNATISEETIGTIEYVSNTLSQLRNMISDYVDGVYQTKSYIENSINYNRFLAALNGINKILEEIPEKED